LNGERIAQGAVGAPRDGGVLLPIREHADEFASARELTAWLSMGASAVAEKAFVAGVREDHAAALAAEKRRRCRALLRRRERRGSPGLFGDGC